MRDSQAMTCLQRGNRFAIGMISSSKPFRCVSLSEILESKVSEKYYLSAKACAGILRRAEKRGKELPEHLKAALEAVVFPERTEPARGT